MHSPTRRALGEKDTNTHLKVRPSQSVIDFEKNESIFDGAELLRVPGTDKVTQIAPTIHKRKIDEVEDAERMERNHPANSQNTQNTLLLDDTSSDSELETEDVSMSTYQRSYETAGTSFMESQNPVEPQFELQQEEMSQRTLEKLNAVPLPQNTSQLPPWQPTLLNDGSAGSIGLSTYFNLDDQASTQGSDCLQMLEPVVHAQVEPNLREEEHHPQVSKDQEATTTAPTSTIASEKIVHPSIIEAARTRLQLAMYKVQTKQTHRPFSRLRPEPLAMTRLSAIPRLVPTQQATTTSDTTSSDATITLDIYRRGASNRYQDIHARPRENEGIDLDHPPRAKSVVTDSCKNSQSSNPGTHNFLSSPPLSREPSTDSLEELLPPINAQGKIRGLPQESSISNSSQRSSGSHQQQLSSPPISDNGRARSFDSKAQQIGQGEAATGLLQLLTGGAGLCGV